MNLISALRSNAAFTGACALICLLASGYVARHTAVPDVLWIIALGVMLLAFVPMLLFAAARPIGLLVRLIIALDWGYVAIAIIYLGFNWQKADALGAGMIAFTALVVSVFAIVQKQQHAAMLKQES